MITYTIQMPPIFSQREPWSFIRTSDEWLAVGAARTGKVISVPSSHFDRRIEDEAAFQIGADFQLSQFDGGERPIERHSVVLAMESPHKHELETGRPLSGPGNREHVLAHLPRLLRRAEAALRVTVRGRQVILANPIQYQASLQALLREPEKEMKRAIRTAVWRELFKVGGDADFQMRLQNIEPSLVLFAPTHAVRAPIRQFAASLRFPWARVDRHPSVWKNGWPILVEFGRGSSRSSTG